MSYVDQAEAAKRRDAYLRDREERKREAKKWRLAHKEKLRKYKKRYRKQLKSGQRVAQRRIKVGPAYAFIGTHPPVGLGDKEDIVVGSRRVVDRF